MLTSRLSRSRADGRLSRRTHVTVGVNWTLTVEDPQEGGEIKGSRTYRSRATSPPRERTNAQQQSSACCLLLRSAHATDLFRCFCGRADEDYTIYGASEECAYRCTGDVLSTCGGFFAMDIFALDGERKSRKFNAGLIKVGNLASTLSILSSGLRLLFLTELTALDAFGASCSRPCLPRRRSTPSVGMPLSRYSPLPC